jgi:hypothetical protein
VNARERVDGLEYIRRNVREAFLNGIRAGFCNASNLFVVLPRTLLTLKSYSRPVLKKSKCRLHRPCQQSGWPVIIDVLSTRGIHDIREGRGNLPPSRPECTSEMPERWHQSREGRSAHDAIFARHSRGVLRSLQTRLGQSSPYPYPSPNGLDRPPKLSPIDRASIH